MWGRRQRCARGASAVPRPGGGGAPAAGARARRRAAAADGAVQARLHSACPVAAVRARVCGALAAPGAAQRRHVHGSGAAGVPRPPGRSPPRPSLRGSVVSFACRVTVVSGCGRVVGCGCKIQGCRLPCSRAPRRMRGTSRSLGSLCAAWERA